MVQNTNIMIKKLIQEMEEENMSKQILKQIPTRRIKSGKLYTRRVLLKYVKINIFGKLKKIQ